MWFFFNNDPGDSKRHRTVSGKAIAFLTKKGGVTVFFFYFSGLPVIARAVAVTTRPYRKGIREYAINIQEDS